MELSLATKLAIQLAFYVLSYLLMEYAFKQEI